MIKIRSLLTLGIGIYIQSLYAIPFSCCNDDIQGTLDSFLSFEIGARVTRIEDDLVGGVNNNQDDGDLNYRLGNLYETAFKGASVLNATYKVNTSICVSADAIFDPLILYSHPERTSYSETAKHILGRRLRLLDCYLSHHQSVRDSKVTFKIGNQRINWGASTFINNGLNSINPHDVTKLRSPGNLIEMALMPIWCARLDVEFDQEWSAYTWWQWHWVPTQLDPKGTFFSTTDTLSPGGFFLCLAPTPSASDIDPESTYTFFPPINPFLRRGDTQEGCDTQNFGACVQYSPSCLKETSFAAYGAVYASRLPILGGFRGDLSFVSIPNFPLFSFPNFATAKYLIQYPNHIGLLGASFNTVFRGVGLRGEYSLHLGQPFQRASSEIFSQVPGSGGVFDFSGAPDSFYQVVNGYKRKNYSQLQVSGMHDCGCIFGADHAFLIWEAGVCQIHNMGHGLYAYRNSEGTIFVKPSAFSAGYTICFAPTYEDVFCSFSLTPNVAFTQGLFGNTPEPLQTFYKDNYRYSLGLTADYEKKYQFNFIYTANFGGTLANLLRDRHFVQLSAACTF
jgi:hypothetical protein